MLKIKSTTKKSIPAVVVLVLGLMITPWLGSQVFARQGSDDTPAASTPTTPGSGTNETSKAAGSDESSRSASSGNSSGSSSSSNSNTKKSETEVHKSTEANGTVNEEHPHGKLEAAKLRVCKNHEDTIGAVMGRVSERGQKQLDLYTAITGRVQKFYTDKGHVLNSYDNLVATVSAQKAVAQATVTKLAADKAGFKCDGADPRGNADAFKADQKAVTDSLKAYRTAIKALIQGVKSVQPDVSKITTSDTPSTTKPQGAQQ